MVLLLKNSYNSLLVLKTASTSWMFHLLVDLTLAYIKDARMLEHLDGSFHVHFSFCLGVQVFITHLKKMIICCLFLLYIVSIFSLNRNHTFVMGSVTMVYVKWFLLNVHFAVSLMCWIFIPALCTVIKKTYVCFEQMNSTNNFDLCGPGTTFKHTFFQNVFSHGILSSF